MDTVKRQCTDVIIQPSHGLTKAHHKTEDSCNKEIFIEATANKKSWSEANTQTIKLAKLHKKSLLHLLIHNVFLQG